MVDKPFKFPCKPVVNFHQSRQYLKFVKRIVDEKGQELSSQPPLGNKEGAADIQVFDLSSAEITEDSLRLDVIQQSLDKLSRKVDSLSKSQRRIEEAMALMTTSLQMLSDSYVNTRVIPILRAHAWIKQKTINFRNVNSPLKLDDYIQLFVKDTGVRGGLDVVKKSLHLQEFLSDDGKKYMIDDMLDANWLSVPYDITKNIQTRKFVCGEVSIQANNDILLRSLYRMLRIPMIIRRYTQKIHLSLFKTVPRNQMVGLEKGRLFLIFGALNSQEEFCLAPSSLNRVLTPKEIDGISEEIFDGLDGTLYLPSDEEIVAYGMSDLVGNSLGMWYLFMQAEWNGKKIVEVPEEPLVKIALLLKLIALNNFDLLVATCMNN